MKIICKSSPVKCGVYIIVNLSNKKFYIGSSKDIYYRLHRHKSDLINNKHHNPILTNTYNKGSILLGIVLEYCDEDNRVNREQYWMDLLKPEYNIIKDATTNTPSKESVSKMRDTLIRRYGKGEIKAYRQVKKWIPINQYTLDGIFIAKYACVADAALATGINRNNINECVRLPNRQIAGGFRWTKYEN